MSDTPTLWDLPSQARPMVDIPLSYRADGPDTSKQAAKDNAPRRRAQHDRVLRALASFGHAGAVDAEVALRADMDKGTVATRRRELEELGLIVRTEERRPTPSGSTAIVFRLTDVGWAEAS